MKKKVSVKKYIAAVLVVAGSLMTACGNTAVTNDITNESSQETESESSVIEENAVAEENVVSEENAVAEEPSASEKETRLKMRSKEHKYVHGDEGYYNILEDGIEFELVSQYSGTCWLCASACSMMTEYQRDHDKTIILDQYDLLDEIYDDDKAEGVFVSNGTDKKKLGGSGAFVVNELSLGFGEGLVLDDAICTRGWSSDEIKEGLRKYGALYIGIPDSKKGYYDNYYTMNYPTDDPEEYDHSIAILGWDDSFPKENFMTRASQDGAWITYNSNHPGDYFYVSYDTSFDQYGDLPFFMAISEDYGKVVSYDRGIWSMEPFSTGNETVTANVFSEEGTLAAVGTYTLEEEQDLTVQIMTPDLKDCLYTEDFHADRIGYHTFRLKEPQKVDEYAVVVSYAGGAPVEGGSHELDTTLRAEVVSEEGQSFILCDGEWLDMSKETTWDRVGLVTNNACIRALYTK